MVSSVVERLVYTENVGGSKPSPPTDTNTDALILHLFFYVCLELVESSTILGYDYGVPHLAVSKE